MTKGINFEKETKRKVIRERGFEPVGYEDRTLSPSGFGKVAGSVGERRSSQLEVTPPIGKSESREKALAAILEGEQIKAEAKARMHAKRLRREASLATTKATAKAIGKKKQPDRKTTANKPRETQIAVAHAPIRAATIAYQHMPRGVRREVVVEVAPVSTWNRKP